jgi:acyl-CoA thioester hydrolase
VARIDRRRLDGADFPTSMTIATRFSDLDVQGHVNNAAAAVLLQEARAGLNRAAAVSELREGLRPVVASLLIEYAGEMHHPEPVEIATGVLEIGRTSVLIGQVGRQGGRTTLYAETVLVMTAGAGPTPIPDSLRAAYERATIRPAEVVA